MCHLASMSELVSPERYGCKFEEVFFQQSLVTDVWSIFFEIDPQVNATPIWRYRKVSNISRTNLKT